MGAPPLRVRRSALLAACDPLVLHVAPDARSHAAGRVFLDDGLAAAHAPGRAAGLVRFNFNCSPTAGGAPAAREHRKCQLRSAPLRWEGAMRDVVVEAVLVRGFCALSTPSADPVASGELARAVLVRSSVPAGGGTDAPQTLAVERTPVGLLVRMAAPLQGPWAADLACPPRAGV